MVVDDLDTIRGAIAPDKTDAPLVIDPDAMLAAAVSCQGFETITRRRAQVRQPDCGGEHVELSERH
jgi:hypothetical protein